MERQLWLPLGHFDVLMSQNLQVKRELTTLLLTAQPSVVVLFVCLVFYSTGD